MVRFNRDTFKGPIRRNFTNDGFEEDKDGMDINDGDIDINTETQNHSDDSDDEQIVTYRKAQIMIESIKNESIYMKRAALSFNSEFSGGAGTNAHHYDDVIVRKNSIDDGEEESARRGKHAINGSIAESSYLGQSMIS